MQSGDHWALQNASRLYIQASGPLKLRTMRLGREFIHRPLDHIQRPIDHWNQGWCTRKQGPDSNQFKAFSVGPEKVACHPCQIRERSNAIYTVQSWVCVICLSICGRTIKPWVWVHDRAFVIHDMYIGFSEKCEPLLRHTLEILKWYLWLFIYNLFFIFVQQNYM